MDGEVRVCRPKQSTADSSPVLHYSEELENSPHPFSLINKNIKGGKTTKNLRERASTRIKAPGRQAGRQASTLAH